jgi:drug/metabolite transporter (DMT)-like permease
MERTVSPRPAVAGPVDAPPGGRPTAGVVAALLAVGALLGLATNLAKVAQAEGTAATAFLAWSCLIGAGLLAAGNRLAGRTRPRGDARYREYVLVAAVLTVAAPNLLLFTAAPRVGAGFAVVTVAFPPLLTYAGALLLGLERYALRRAAGVAVAILGALVVAAGKMAAPDAPVGWVLAVLAVPVLLAAGNLYRTVRWPPGASTEDVAPGMLATSALLVFAFATLAGAPLLPSTTPTGLGLTALQGGIFAVFYRLYFVVQRRGGPVFLSLLGSVAAVVGVPVAVLVLGESWPAGIAPAGLLVAAGIALLVTGARRG